MSRNETDIKVAGQWKHLYRAADGDGHTIDFLLRAKRDCAAARRFLERATDLHGVPEKIAIDKSGANTAAIKSMAVSSPKCNTRVIGLRAQLDESQPGFERRPATA